MRSTAIYPGTFDPPTLGHIDLIKRAARIFDRLIVAVATGEHKNVLLELDHRVELMRRCLEGLDNVTVEPFEGLLVDFARSRGARVLVRGIRAFSDFEFEFQMALTNRKMASEIETIFLMPKEEYSYVSSSVVREIAALGGDTSPFVPEPVYRVLQNWRRRKAES